MRVFGEIGRCRRALGMLACCAGAALCGPSLASAASTWLPQQQLSDAGQSITGNVALAADQQGTVLGAWPGYDGSHYRIDASVRAPGGSFSSPGQVLSAAGADALEPAAAFDSPGNAIVVWSRNGVVQYASRPFGGTFGAAQDLSPGGESGTQPQVAFDSQGDTVVFWTGTSGSGSNETVSVRYAVRPAGGSFGPAQQLDSATSNNAPNTMETAIVSPLARDGQGDVFAAWTIGSIEQSPSQRSYAIKAAIIPSGGSALGPTTLATTGMATMDILDMLSLAADPQGDAIAVWRHASSSTTIEGSFRSAGGLFTSLGTLNTGGFMPAVAMDGQGNAILVFVGGGSVQQMQRPAGGAFGTPQPFASSTPNAPMVTFNTAGDAVITWGQNNTIEGAVQPAGGSFGMPTPISSGGTFQSPQSLVADGQGDVIAAWNPIMSSARVAEIGVYDASNPVLQSLSIPATGTAGSPLSFSVDPLSIWLSIDSTSWTFGDGSSAGGANVSHTYGAPGAYPVQVTATDSIGNTATLGGNTQIAAAAGSGSGGSGGGGSGGGGSTGAGSTGAGSGSGGQAGPGGSNGATGGGGAVAVAAVSAVGETNSVFAVGPSSTPLTGQAAATRHAKGTVFSFQLDRPATMRIAIQSLARGRRVGRTCRADSRRLRRKPRCTRVVTIATLTRGAHAGLNRVPFTGRIGGRALRPGHYQAVFTAVNPAGSSPRRTLAFTIVKR